VPEGAVEAQRASDRADALLAKALESNQRGDDYAILTVLFALVLFFVAVSERSRMHWSGWFLLGLGIAVAIVGIVILVTFPILV
jgi:inner membrane protein involved in colicin E2 resistance